MNKTSLLTGLLVICQLTHSWAGNEIPVLLRVPKTGQPDSLGYNFTQQVTKLVYKLINENKIRLWDSPAKDIQIVPSTLNQLENSSRTEFCESDLFYIYENWEKQKTGINTQTLGFAFLNKNKLGEDVSYGFVEYSELKNYFIREYLETNANGDCEINFAAVLYKKRFHYNIIQFNGKALTTGGESNDIKLNFINGLEFNPTIQLPDRNERMVYYSIENIKNPGDEKSKITNLLLKQVENYLALNEEVFFNIGGDRFSDFLAKGKLKVTRMDVTERWRKTAENIYSETLSIIIYVNDSALDVLSYDDFIMLGIQVNDKSMHEIFREKNFTFYITKINSQPVARREAYFYYKGLLTSDWRNLTSYVKNF